MDFQKIIERVKSILLSPKQALEDVQGEDMTISGTMKGYVMILAAIPAIAHFIGSAIIGLPFVGRQNLGRTLIFAALSFGLSLAAVFIVSKVINALAPNFNSVKNDLNAFKLSVYFFTPFFVAGAFNLIPSLSILALLGSLYGIYILYIGLPILMKAPEDKVLVYTVVTLILCLVVMLIVSFIAGAIAWGGSGPARYF